MVPPAEPTAIAGGVAGSLNAGGICRQGGEPLHPPGDGYVVDLDAALGEQLFDITVGRCLVQR
jgi:hypothetical protein